MAARERDTAAAQSSETALCHGSPCARLWVNGASCWSRYEGWSLQGYCVAKRVAVHGNDSGAPNGPRAKLTWISALKFEKPPFCGSSTERC